MSVRLVPSLVTTLVVLGAATVQGQEVIDGFAARTYTARRASLPYRLFTPNEAARRRPLPLIVYLHGSGGLGTDNLRQISGGNTAATRRFATPAMQSRHPAFVVAPQAPANRSWGAPESDTLSPYAALVLELIETLSKEFMIDPDRIYLMGQSLGGYGTWDIVSKRPVVFAAAVPLCGGGNVTRVRAVRHMAIWAFHGAKDPVVPVTGSRELVAALKAAGSPVKYTEYADVEHDVWTRAFAEPELPDWLFAQKRSRH